MPAPVISWYDRNNTNPLSSWIIGTVDAGSVSANLGILIWNNRGGSEDVSDMQNCSLTTKDSNGGNTGEVVLNTWIEVRVDSLSESSFTPIGGNVTKAIRTDGSTTNSDGTWTPNVPPHAGEGTSFDILGVKNDGTKVNAAGNFVEVTVHANVPSNAGAGTTNFRLRVAYQYT